ETLEEQDRMRVDAALGLAASTVGAERRAADLVEDRLSYDRARRIAGAQEEDVERLVRHACGLGRAAGGCRCRGGLWPAARRLLVRHAHDAFAAAVAVVRALAGGEERLPGDSRGIVDPRLFRLGVAAGRLPLFDDLAAGLMEAGV